MFLEALHEELKHHYQCRLNNDGIVSQKLGAQGIELSSNRGSYFVFMHNDMLHVGEYNPVNNGIFSYGISLLQLHDPGFEIVAWVATAIDALCSARMEK